MDDSDDEFKELCAKLLRRVKRNADEGNNHASRRGHPNGKTSTAAKTLLKLPKPVAKSKCKDEKARKKNGLCAKPEAESNRLHFESKELGTEEQAACTSNVPAHLEEAPKVLISPSRKRNEHLKPQPGDNGNTCPQMAPCAENPEASCKDTRETNTQPSAACQTGCTAVGIQPHSEMQTAPILGIVLQTESELASLKSVQLRVDVESAEYLGIPVNVVDAPEENVPPCFAMKTTPEEPAQCQAALKTVRAKVACPKVVDQALEKMKQFKRADPRRMKHFAEEIPTATSNMNVLVQDQLEHVKDPTISVTENDRDFALALQQDIPIQSKVVSLEEEGLYFCQLCQKDLSAMNSALRQQHMNRCLDEVETSGSLVPVSVSARIPECPICGKQFNTAKSRASHLKRCATTMQVSPQMLLQAVQMQALNSEVSLPVLSSTAGRAKRKGSTKETVPSKRHKHNTESTKAEDMLMALVMSRSLLDQESPDERSEVTSGKTEVDQQVRLRPTAEKKSRKKKDAPPPVLLIQNPETAIKQIQNRVAALLTEEMEFSCTPVLPPSRFWDKSQDIEWQSSSAKGRDAVLWQYSAMMDTPPLEFFYTKELVPPISVWTTPQNQKPAIFSAAMYNEKQLLCPVQSSIVGANPVDCAPPMPAQRRLSTQLVGSSCCQMDKEALQDLMDLAGEGITLTQWKLGADQNPSIDSSGKDSMISDIAQSGFVPSSKDNIKERMNCCHSPLTLTTLAADFSGMVNNPHLSDVQFQMDSGEVLYAHMFVLYARCPLLVELVHSEGILVEEDGGARTRRILLNDISADAACSFLRYLYCASTDISSCCLSDVAALSVRFDVRELLNICENNNPETPVSDRIASGDELYSEENEENSGVSRADNLQELLKSMWMDEDEEVLAELEAEGLEDNKSLVEDEKVNEDELEEIYEFASTQRKVAVYHSGEDTEVGLDSETENTQNPHHKPGYLVEHVDPSERKRGEMEVHNFVENVPSVPLYSNEKLEFLKVTKDTSIAMEGEPPPQGNRPECSYSTESPIPESKEKSTMGKAAEHAVDELDSPILVQAVSEDYNNVLLQEPHSQHSCHGLNDSYDRMFLDTFDEYLEPSQVDHKKNHLGLKVVEKCDEVSYSSLLSSRLEESLPSETSHCKSPIVNQCFSVLPALGLSPPSSNQDRTPLVEEIPQSQSSPYKSIKPGISTTPPLKTSPLTHCLTLQTTELGSRTHPTNVLPQNVASPFASPDVCKEKTQFFQSSPQSPCLLFPSPEPDRANISIESQCSPFSCLESMRKKNNGSLFSAEAVSKLKKVVQGIALNYSNRMKQDADSPTKSIDFSKQSTAVQTKSPFAEKDNIIVLDSDEETELDQQIKKSPTYSPFSMKQDLFQSTSTIGKVKTSPQQLMFKKTFFSYLEQIESASVPVSEACRNGTITPERESSSNLKLHLSCDDDQVHEETSSSRETSWLVPATPLLSQSRNCSSHIQMASLQNLSKLKQLHRPGSETSVDDSHSLTNVPKIKSKETPNLLLSASQLPEISEENLKYPLTSSLASKITAQDFRNKDHVDGSTGMKSAEKSVTIPCLPSLACSISFSAPVYIPPGSPYSPRKVISVDLSPEKESSNSSVFERVDGLGDHTEVLLPSSNSLQMDFDLPVPAECLTTPEKDKSELVERNTPNFTRLSSRESDTESVLWKSQSKHLKLTGIRHDTKSLCQHNSDPLEHESSLQMADSLQNSKLSFFNTSEWDDWNGEEDNVPAAIPLSQSISNQSASTKPKTPVATLHKRNQVPVVPITPLPSYSDMDTPKLKKELDRFGVRALPKRKMVLKLKEIFQYTHQTMSSDSEEEIPTAQFQATAGSVCLSQPIGGVSAQRQGRCSTAAPRKRKTAISSQPPSDSSSERPKKTSNLSFKKPAKSQKSCSTPAKRKWISTFSPTKSSVKDTLPTMAASQESTASSAAGSDISFESQSSSTNEFETAFASGEEEDDEFITSSQAAVQEKDKAEALRRYLHLNPDLHNKILLYEPIELAGLQAELKQNGIKIAMGKLLDFLDTHCITFTTAAARKEKLEKKQKKHGKKKLPAK